MRPTSIVLAFALCFSTATRADDSTPSLAPIVDSAPAAGVSITAEADSFDALVAKVKPTLTWNDRDLLWARRDNGHLVFTVDRAFGHAHGATISWTLINAKPYAALGADWEGQYLRETMTLGKNKDSDAGNWAIVVSSHASTGTLYEIGWETRLPRGEGKWVEARRLFVLRDRNNHWRFVGEGPGDRWGRPAPGRVTHTTQDYRIRWTSDPAAPLAIRVTSRQESFVEDKADERLARLYPPLTVLHDGVLAGALPARFERKGRPYVRLDAGTSLESLAARLTAWKLAADADLAQRQTAVAAVRMALAKLNPEAELGVRHIDLPDEQQIARIVAQTTTAEASVSGQ